MQTRDGVEWIERDSGEREKKNQKDDQSRHVQSRENIYDVVNKLSMFGGIRWKQ